MEHWHPGTVERHSTIPHLGWDTIRRHSSISPNLIVVGDDESNAGALARQLRENGFAVIRVPLGGCALAYLGAGGTCDAIVVDLDFAAAAGLPWIQRIARSGASPPVLILRDDGGDIPAQLTRCNGSVEFVDRTPKLAELADRIGLSITGARTGDGRDVDADRVECGPLRLKANVCRAYWRGRKVPLTMTEFRIVLKLAAQPDEDVSYRDIYDVVHGEGFIAGDGDQGYRANVRSLIKKIRKKFGAIDDGFDAIENYPGFGYRWVRRRSTTAGETEPSTEVPPNVPMNGHGAEPQFDHLLDANGAETIAPLSIRGIENAKGTSTMGDLRRDRSAASASARSTAVARRGVDEKRNGIDDTEDTASDVHRGIARRDGVNGMNGHDQNGAADATAGHTARDTPENPQVRRPWGCFQTVDAGDRFQVKRIVVQPGSRLSLQMHHHRAEHWIVVHGTAKVFRDGETLLLRSNESLYIPSGAKHRLENPGKVPLLLIEVQWGDYLGEDDIVRFEDSYGRV